MAPVQPKIPGKIKTKDKTMTTPAAKQKNYGFEDIFDADASASGVDPNASNNNYDPFEQMTLWKNPIRLFRKKEFMADKTEVNQAFASVTPLFEPFDYKADGVEFSRHFSFHQSYKNNKTYNIPCLGKDCPVCAAGDAPQTKLFVLVIQWNRYKKEKKGDKWIINGYANPRMGFIFRGNNDITNYGESVSNLTEGTYRGSICRVTLKPDNPKGNKENFFAWALSNKLPRDKDKNEFNPFTGRILKSTNWVRDKDDEDQVIKVTKEIKDATYEYIQHKKIDVNVKEIDFLATYDRETPQGVKEFPLIEMPLTFPKPTSGSVLENLYENLDKKYNLSRKPDWNNQEDALLWAKLFHINFPKKAYTDYLDALNIEDSEGETSSGEEEFDANEESGLISGLNADSTKKSTREPVEV